MSRDEADGLELDDCMAWANGGRFGGAKRDRTADLLRARQALSQLSYGPVTSADLRVTLEPA